TRVFTGDGRLMAEFAEEKRVFVPITSIPPLVREAFLSAEDQHFYEHKGLDFQGIGRAVLVNLRNAGTDSRLVGASTITQQVAKNMLLTNEVSFERKFKEAILALRMERVIPKDRILELYLNDIYLGQGAYGVAAAAQTYYNKGLDELNIEEVAYLGALPKAPSNYHPIKRRQQALDRRNWVIGRMQEDGYITKEEAQIARMKPLTVVDQSARKEAVRSPYFAEEIRRFLGENHGLDSVYKDGLTVRSTLDPALQDMAERAFRYGIVQYERRHGWRGPIARYTDITGWKDRLSEVPFQKGMLPDWQIGLVIQKNGKGVTIGLSGGDTHPLHADDIAWAGDALQVGDIVMVGPKSYLDYKQKPKPVPNEDGTMPEEEPEPDDSMYWHLRQVPVVQGGLVAMDPYTGRVLAMQGGWDYEKSEFNRVTQAQRQLGSAFKPFIYLAALEDGYTPVTKVLDAPISFSMGYGQGVWSPTNYEEDEYYGPTTIRVGIEKSRNLMTVRLAAHLGMKRVAQTVERFGIYDKMETHLANALGAQETTLLRLTTAYAMLANGGQKITPTFIDRVQDRAGHTVFARDKRQCVDCGPRIQWTPGQEVPEPKLEEDLVTDPRVAYQMTSILEGVVQRGTAASRLKDIDYPLAGKTGTTNDSKDVWFIGYSPEIVVGCYVGFDQPRTLGKETGGSTAVPMFRAFMEEYIKGRDPQPFRVPPGISLVEVNAATGQRTSPDDPRAIFEAFLKEQEPEDTYVYDPEQPAARFPTGTDTGAPDTAIDSGVSTPPETENGVTPEVPSGNLGGTGGIY
ncbi:MAG: PBP1A family penicillin-binding protein, partial [Alphaproteobacteria bacterium]|nr:PBP1A family penicillin-binding protein [Alphaproteobacteria bacterium]